MTFLEKIKPHLITDDILVQEFVLHALHDFTFIPENWTVELLNEAFSSQKSQSSIFVWADKHILNEDALKVLLQGARTFEKDKLHLLNGFFENLDVKLAIKYKQELVPYINKKTWNVYELILNGNEEEVYTEYGRTLAELDNQPSLQFDAYVAAKKLARCIVENQWVTVSELDIVLKQEQERGWVSYEGILAVYMMGIMKNEKHISILASLLEHDEDLLLEEVTNALISYQSDKVVSEVAPYLKKTEALIYATSILENIKSPKSVEVLIDALPIISSSEDQSLIIEALCFQLSKDSLKAIKSFMVKYRGSSYVDIEQVVYSYFTILGESHPHLTSWKEIALEKELHFNNSLDGSLQSETPVLRMNITGRNEPCPCGSGKKYKKCCID